MTAEGLPYWLPGAPPPPPRTGGAVVKRVFTAILVVVLAAAGLAVGNAIGRAGAPAFQEAAVPVPPRPGPDATEREWEEYVAAAAAVILDRQAEALLAGDERGWLAPYDADDAELIDDQRTRFDSLRALQVTNWAYEVDGRPRQQGGSNDDEREFDVDLLVGYCFGSSDPAGCLPTDVKIPTEWSSTPSGLVITDVDPSSADQAGPRPFEVTELVAESSDRVIVAAPPQYENRLKNAVDIAEAAAENADRYAHWKKVDRYVVFLASDEEFSEWYGTGEISENVVGFALPLGSVDEQGEWRQTGIEVVMHVERLGNSRQFTSTMRHEFGHVVMLLGTGDVQTQPEDFFLNEGIAEYIDYGDGPIGDYPRIDNVAAYLDQISWNGELDPVDQFDDGLAGSAKYGLAFLAVKYMIDTYGLDKFNTFFEHVVRNGEDAGSSSETAFGESWSKVLNKIEDYVNDAV